jgi:succinate dehydrogenase/fumarate reductase cytochrome b subunit
MPLSFSEALARAQSVPARFQAFSRTLNALQGVFNFVLRVSGVLLAVFLIHQLFFWFSKDPEKAFNFATLLIDVIEIVWDLFGILYNAVADIFNAAVIPLWNGFTYYVIEPGVTLILEVFSLIFLRKPYQGFIKADDFPYGGFVCEPTSFSSSSWCGRYNAYSQRLSGGDSLTKQSSVTFGTETARRLSEISGEADFDVPSVDTGDLVGALDGLATQAIVMGASVLDVLFAVAYEVFSTTAVFLFDAAYTILKILFEVLKMVIKSGLLQTLISVGVDFIIIMALEVYVPYLIAVVDAVVCILQLLSWQSWGEQLKCGALHGPF